MGKRLNKKKWSSFSARKEERKEGGEERLIVIHRLNSLMYPEKYSKNFGYYFYFFIFFLYFFVSLF